MFNTEPRRFDLNETRNIWLRENDSLIRLSFSFPLTDVSDYLFSINYQEINWDFLSAIYDRLVPGSFDDEVFDLSDGENGNVKINIPMQDIFRNKTLQCQLVCNNGESTWVVCEFHLTTYFSD